MDSSKDRLEKHYGPRIKQYEESYKILDWESREAQQARFRVLSDNVPLEGASLLDVGSGCGDLYGFLKSQGISADYTGVDILAEMVDKARELYPRGRFVWADVFAASSGEALSPAGYDVVFTSGIFNLNLGNNREFFARAAEILANIARKYLVINLLDESSPGRDGRYFYFSPSEAAGTLEVLGWEVRIVKGYLNNDFTLIGRSAGVVSGVL